MPVSSSESPARVAFRYPNFRYYMTARFLITASSEMQSVGVAWQIYGIRHRPLDLASFPCLDDSTNHENGRRTVALRYGFL